MTEIEQKKLREVNKDVENLQRAITEGSKLLRWLKKRKSLIPQDALIRISVDTSSALHKDWRTEHIWCEVPASLAYQALQPHIETLVSEAKKTLSDMPLPGNSK